MEVTRTETSRDQVMESNGDLQGATVKATRDHCTFFHAFLLQDLLKGGEKQLFCISYVKNGLK